MTRGLKKPSGQTWARFAYNFREKAEKLEEENARLRTFIRMIAAFEGEWQADAQEVLAASTEEKP